MILRPRSPRKHQIHLHLEAKQKTPRQHHGHLCTGGGGGNRAKPAPRQGAEGGVSPRTTKRRAGAPSGPAIPANPTTYTARQLPVPIVGTRRSFPSPTMTPFLSEKKLTTSPGAGAGSTALLPAGLRAGPAAPPRKGCAPRVRAGAGRASGSTAGAADPPEGRGLHQPDAEAQPTSRSGADTRQVRAGSTSAGRGDGESAEGPGGGRAPPPVGAPHRGRGALKRRVCGLQGGGRLGLGNCGVEGGGASSSEAEAPNWGAGGHHPSDLPRLPGRAQ